MIKKLNYKKIITYAFWLVFYILIFLVLLKNSFSYLDPDLGWHLRVGEEILQNNHVPTSQTYMWTLKDQNWVDHEWLLNLITYSIFQNFGYITLSIIFALVPLLGMILLNLHAKKKYINNLQSDIFIGLIQILGLFACLSSFGVRMQEITFLFLIILFILLDKLKSEQKMSTTIFTIILFFVWACMHAGFLIGLFVLFFKLLIDIIFFLLNRKSLKRDIKIFELKHIKLLGITALLSFLATLITPYGLNLYKFLYDYRDSFYKFHIQEWLSPLAFIPLQYPKLFYIALVIVVIIFILIFEKISIKQKHVKNIYYWQLLITIIFIYLSLSSLRHMPLLFISSFFFLTIFVDELFGNYYKYIKIEFLKIVAIFLMLVFSIYIITFIKPTSNPFSNYCNYYPCEFSKFLDINPQYKKYKIFNYYTWGGYFIYNHPDMRLFIDGRLPQYEFKDKTILEEYYNFFDKSSVYNKLSEYKINMIVFNKKTDTRLDWFEKNILKINEAKLNNKENVVIDYIKGSSEWTMLYEDSNTLAYIKK